MSNVAVHSMAAPAAREQEAPRSSFARVPSAFKLQFTVPSQMIWVPLSVFLLSWAVAIGIGLWLRHVSGDGPTINTGASQATIWCLAFIAAYSASHTFPFSMALSYSRRVFVLGAFLAFATVSAGFGALFSIAILLERATGGFWAESYTFDIPAVTQNAGVLGAGILAGAVCLWAMMFGFFWSILYRRVSLAMLWIIALGLVALLAVTIMVVAQNQWWPHVGDWLAVQSSYSFAGWVLLLTLVLTAVNYLVIRRAVPTA
ncbi:MULTISPECIES: hypothetical protein [unclassified Nesterenkonia]|uniref:hypothetical protein n=1 Tax=unclassified Nesterenkonia TaxID=2629769 RepID=UPI001F4CFF9F|nr:MULTISPECIES: hypothetical protein [unclassified Nesterenkonia]MCH8560076.1 hypothetical protein [Nesterenkonia sp. DZ6]MCH8562257.1 hypothetical protein [Nesterenkonia sp. YGD6]MCH8569840.1 hypothetical protein [Nesterenkonia sp. AY15]